MILVGRPWNRRPAIIRSRPNLQLGFAHQGVMFIFEVATEWYDSFQSLMETVTDLGGIVVDDRDLDE